MFLQDGKDIVKATGSFDCKGILLFERRVSLALTHGRQIFVVVVDAKLMETCQGKVYFIHEQAVVSLPCPKRMVQSLPWRPGSDFKKKVSEVQNGDWRTSVDRYDIIKTLGSLGKCIEAAFCCLRWPHQIGHRPVVS